MLRRVVGLWLALVSLAAPAAICAATGEDVGDALRQAARDGNLTKVKKLVADGADVNAATSSGGTPLAFAAGKGRVEVADYLLQHGARVNTESGSYVGSPLTWAIDEGDRQAAVVRLLLEKGAVGEEFALVAAAGGGHAAIVAVILERGRVSAEDLSDALDAASGTASDDVLALLRAAGARPHVTVAVDPAVLASYAGVYEGEDLTLTVEVKERTLVITGAGAMDGTYLASTPTLFRSDFLPMLKVDFEVEAGKVRGLTLRRGFGRQSSLARKRAAP